MPYTYNHKYTPPSVVKIIKYASSFYTPPEITSPIQDNRTPLPSLSCDIETTHIDNSLIEFAKQIYSQILKNTPLKADNSTKDYSIADARFVTYMLRQGYSEKQIYSLLFHVSPQLIERKRGTVKQYLIRTIQAIANFISINK